MKKTIMKQTVKSSGILFLLFIMAGVSLAEPVTRGQAQGTTIPSQAASAVEPAFSCFNPQQCREIDEVWRSIGPRVRGSEEVWDGVSQLWKAFTVLYPAAGVPPAIIPGPAAYDSIIQEAAAATGVEFAFIKAIMVAESDFKPNDISDTGCSGLLQICGSSAKEEIQVQCPQLHSLGPRKCDATTCQTGRLPKAPNVPWCDICIGANNCVDDDRFDPRKNIFSATKTIQRKMGAIPASLCGMECQAAAYNVGEQVIQAAADAARADLGSGPLGWDDVYNHITTPLMKENGYEDSDTWNEEKREQKRVNLKGYVAKIMRSYQSYKAGAS